MAELHSLKRDRSGPAYSPTASAGAAGWAGLGGTTNLDLMAGSAHRNEQSPTENEAVVLMWLMHGGARAIGP